MHMLKTDRTFSSFVRHVIPGKREIAQFSHWRDTNLGWRTRNQNQLCSNSFATLIFNLFLINTMDKLDSVVFAKHMTFISGWELIKGGFILKSTV